ncbi:hypothetical protein HanIR_Chr13g0667771 [Helianthus annuus]|nr:hypothetical protein HanIR_Chr13g0667771 [Helianthus annuus]
MIYYFDEETQEGQRICLAQDLRMFYYFDMIYYFDENQSAKYRMMLNLHIDGDTELIHDLAYL